MMRSSLSIILLMNVLAGTARGEPLADLPWPNAGEAHPYIAAGADPTMDARPPRHFHSPWPAAPDAPPPMAPPSIAMKTVAATPPTPSVKPAPAVDETAHAKEPATPVILASFAPVLPVAADPPQADEFEQWRARVALEGFAQVEEMLLAEFVAADNPRDIVIFYMAHDLWPEALAMMREQNGAGFALYEGVAHYQMGRWSDAIAVFNADALRENEAAAGWRGLANAQRGADEEAALDLLYASVPAPPFDEEAADFLLAKAQNAFDRGERALARATLDQLRGRALSQDQRGMRRLIEARMMLARDRRDDARSLLETLASSGVQPAANRAALELAKDRLATGELHPDAALAHIKALFLTWNGGAFEREALQLEATLHDAVGDVAESFSTRRRLVEKYPYSDDAETARTEMTQMLKTLTDRTNLSPLAFAEIFYENIDVAPPGEEGDVLIRGVAQELAALDLLKQAAELLRHQVFNRLRGSARSQTAADLAEVYLDSDRPEDALQVLRATRYARLPQALNDRRRWLEARALIRQSETEAALHLLANDASVTAARLRGDIFWKAQDWGAAGAAYAAVLAGVDGAIIDGADAVIALRTAAAFALAGDRAALGDLNADIAPRLADENLQRLFAGLAGGAFGDDPARFLAAYKDYFTDPGGS